MYQKGNPDNFTGCTNIKLKVATALNFRTQELIVMRRDGRSNAVQNTSHLSFIPKKYVNPSASEESESHITTDSYCIRSLTA